VSLVALPGGSIFVDGKSVGQDETAVLTLKPGNHAVRVENRFLGDHEVEISISAGQSGTVKIEW
jgi:archaellum component FlaG (FlaF/FlaG flagellin family)